MRVDQFRHVENAIISLESSTFLELRHRTLRVQYDRRRSYSVSKPTVTFDVAADIGDTFYVANTKHALLLAVPAASEPTPAESDAPVATLLELQTEFPHLTAFGATVPARLLGEAGYNYTRRRGDVRAMLAQAFGWEAVRPLFQQRLPDRRAQSGDYVAVWAERELVTLACTRTRLLGWGADGRPVLAQRGRPDDVVLAEAAAADAADRAALEHAVRGYLEDDAAGIPPAASGSIDARLREATFAQAAGAGLVTDIVIAPPNPVPAAPVSIADQLRAALGRDAEEGVQ